MGKRNLNKVYHSSWLENSFSSISIMAYRLIANGREKSEPKFFLRGGRVMQSNHKAPANTSFFGHKTIFVGFIL